jgi:hypothetical protein
LSVPERGRWDARVFGWDGSSVGRVEVWLRRPWAGQPSISTEQESALAAASGGMWAWLQQHRPTHCRTRYAARTKPDLRDAFCLLCGRRPRGGS